MERIKQMKTISIHAGHNPDGKTACGAVGFLKESTENRNVVKYMKKYLTKCALTVYNDTVDNGTSQNDVLSKIIKKIQKHKVDLIISIHFNSGANDKKGNGKTTGTEIWVKKINDDIESIGFKILNSISSLGFTNRGIKQTNNLYILNNTYDTPTLLIECCFVDDLDDSKKYTAKTMASAICEGIIKEVLSEKTLTFKTNVKGVKERSKPTLTKKYVLGSLKLNTKIVVDDVKIVNGRIYGHRKKRKTWVLLSNTKVVK